MFGGGIYKLEASFRIRIRIRREMSHDVRAALESVARNATMRIGAFLNRNAKIPHFSSVKCPSPNIFSSFTSSRIEPRCQSCFRIRRSKRHDVRGASTPSLTSPRPSHETFTT